jgi:hypothetical protein
MTLSWQPCISLHSDDHDSTNRGAHSVFPACTQHTFRPPHSLYRIALLYSNSVYSILKHHCWYLCFAILTKFMPYLVTQEVIKFTNSVEYQVKNIQQILINSFLLCLLIPLHVSASRCYLQGVTVSLFISYSSLSIKHRIWQTVTDQSMHNQCSIECKCTLKTFKPCFHQHDKDSY